MNTVKFTYEQLKRLCTTAFERYGFTKDEAEIITDVLLRADLYGIESHGVQRLARYRGYIENHRVDIKAKPETVYETPLSAVIDGKGGMGQLVAHGAMSRCIEKAKKTGIAIVTVKNSNHFGIAGYYAKMACDEGFIGVSMTNSESIMVHTNSRTALLGSNPIAIAMPAEPYPFYFDAATTVVPRGKLEVYSKLGKPLPGDWAIDENGEPTSDAPKVLDSINRKTGGGILPLGGFGELNSGYKGYGYAMICEIFTAVLSGGDTSNHHVHKDGRGSGSCHGFMAIDPKLFGDTEAIKNSLGKLLDELRSCPTAAGADRIYTHGEKELESYRDRLKNGINVNIKTYEEITSLCRSLGMGEEYYIV